MAFDALLSFLEWARAEALESLLSFNLWARDEALESLLSFLEWARAEALDSLLSFLLKAVAVFPARVVELELLVSFSRVKACGIGLFAFCLINY